VQLTPSTLVVSVKVIRDSNPHFWIDADPVVRRIAPRI